MECTYPKCNCEDDKNVAFCEGAPEQASSSLSALLYVKVYRLLLDSSAWGNGGTMHHYLDKGLRDKIAAEAHPMSNPIKSTVKVVDIGGELYIMPKPIKLDV